MLAISAGDLRATRSRSARWFQGLFEGNTEHVGPPGSGCAETSAGIATAVAITTTASGVRLL
jgi:hypothetical protein